MTWRLGLLFMSLGMAAPAAVVRLEVTERSAAALGYERIHGRVYFAVDPASPHNRRITDIGLAPRNAAGEVEFSADLYLLRPTDPARSNRTILFEVVNRGKKNLLPMFNRAPAATDPVTAADFGDGLLMKQGYTLAWVGWQHDVPRAPGLMRLYAPRARGVKGLVRSEYAPTSPVDHFSLGDSGHIPYEPTDASSAVVTVRDDIYGTRTRLDAGDWKIQNGTLHLSKPAAPGRIYEVVYEAADPEVAGLGLAAIRDLISYLKAEEGMEWAIGFGVSQSAMVLRALLYEGFNQDENGQRVFDGIFAHVAGARRSTFQRFTQPSRTAGPLRNASLTPTEQGPYTDAGLLERARAAKVVPKIFYSNSAYEYWGSGASLLHTDARGTRDIALSESTRMYVFAGGQHGPAAFPPQPGGGRNLPSFNDYKWSVRALLAPLRAWIVEGTEPPESQYPTLAGRTLVPLSEYAIQGVETPKIIHTPHELDFGPEYLSKGIVTNEPPKPGRAYRTLVPRPDADGNDLGAIRMPEVSCAIAAYTGWNLRSEAVGATQYLMGNLGSYLPFSRAEIEKRFPGESDYLACVTRAARQMATRRLLLPGDIPALRDAASRHWRWRMTLPPAGSVESSR